MAARRTPAPARGQQRARALDLHLAGESYQNIADTLGIPSKGTAHRLVQEALAELADPSTPPPTPTGANTVAIARLDAMLAGLWPKARKGDVQAIDRVLKIEERRDKLQLADAAAAAAAEPEKETGLSDFEKRLAARQAALSTSAAPRRRRTRT